MELSTYFRINAANTGQFERTLVIADEGAYVSYLEGCLPPGEQVSTPTGWRNIESLKPGDLVYDHEGAPRRVRASMTRRHKGEMITIRPVSRYNQFSLTSEHPVLAIKREGVRVKRKARRNGWLPEVDTKETAGRRPRVDPRRTTGSRRLRPRAQIAATGEGWLQRPRDRIARLLPRRRQFLPQQGQQATHQSVLLRPSRKRPYRADAVPDRRCDRQAIVPDRAARPQWGWCGLLLPTVRRLVHRTLR